MKCLCWDNENQDRSDAITFETSDERMAAELFAEEHFSEEPFEFIDVHVESMLNDASWVIRVDVTMEPVFYAGSGMALADVDVQVDPSACMQSRPTMARARRIGAIWKDAVSRIDQSRLARLAGDLGSAEAALDKARALIVDLLLEPGT